MFLSFPNSMIVDRFLFRAPELYLAMTSPSYLFMSHLLSTLHPGIWNRGRSLVEAQFASVSESEFGDDHPIKSIEQIRFKKIFRITIRMERVVGSCVE